MVWPVAICFKLLQSDFSTARSDGSAISVSSVQSNATYPIRFTIYISAVLTLEYAARWMARKRQGTTSFLSGEMTQLVVPRAWDSEGTKSEDRISERERRAQNRREMYSRIWCFQYGQSWPPSRPQLSREWRMPFAARISGRREGGAGIFPLTGAGGEWKCPEASLAQDPGTA